VLQSLRLTLPRKGTIKGGPGDDVLTGTDVRDFVYGFGGNDTLAGRGGSDFLFGGRGDDSLDAGDGPDFAWAEAVTTQGWAATGRTRCGPAFGADSLEGGLGNDCLYAIAGDAAADRPDCGENGGDLARAILRPGDVAVDCERVRTLSP
jgi:Ca2+-binding RTX toxin-like protein